MFLMHSMAKQGRLFKTLPKMIAFLNLFNFFCHYSSIIKREKKQVNKRQCFGVQEVKYSKDLILIHQEHFKDLCEHTQRHERMQSRHSHHDLTVFRQGKGVLWISRA